MELADIYLKFPNHVYDLLRAGWVDGEVRINIDSTKNIEGYFESMTYYANHQKIIEETKGSVLVFRNENYFDIKTGCHICEVLGVL